VYKTAVYSLVTTAIHIKNSKYQKEEIYSLSVPYWPSAYYQLFLLWPFWCADVWCHAVKT